MPRQADDPEVTRRREAWVADVCHLLDLDQATVDAVTPDLLRMVAGVAHGPARPAGPITAMLVGLSAARTGAQDAEAIRATIARVTDLLDGWQA